MRTSLRAFTLGVSSLLCATATAGLAAPPPRFPSLEALIARIAGRPVTAVESLWGDLGIRSTVFERVPPPGETSVSRTDCEHGPNPGAFALLGLTPNAGVDSQLLAFARRPGGYEFLGHVDVSAQRPEPAAVRTFHCEATIAWLAIDRMVTAGPGVLLREEHWYGVDDTGVRLALRYPTRGRVAGGGRAFDREFRSARNTPDPSLESIDVDFTMSYEASDVLTPPTPLPLFSLTRRAVFTWNPGTGTFRLDPGRSSLSASDIDGLATDDDEAFLRRRYTELLDLARAGTLAQKWWLKQFLRRLAASQERRSLERLLR